MSSTVPETSSAQNNKDQKKPENAFLNLLFNIALPVFILNKGSVWWGAVPALTLALAFPLGYGLYDVVKNKKINFISLLGLLNVGVTGGLAIAGSGGLWFAIKEAAFPALIGLFVAASAFSKKPFIRTLILNPQAMNWPLVNEKLQARQKESEFEVLMKRSTFLLAGSFAISAALNFWLALRVFVPIDGALSPEQQSVLLNEQIAQMTSMGMAVIFIPSVVILMGIMFYLFRGITRTTGLSLQEILK